MVLDLGRTLTLDFVLSVEGIAENVTVAASPTLLQTNTAEISNIIDNRRSCSCRSTAASSSRWRS